MKITKEEILEVMKEIPEISEKKAIELIQFKKGWELISARMWRNLVNKKLN